MPNDFHHLLTTTDLHPNKIDSTTGTELIPASQLIYDARWSFKLYKTVGPFGSTGNDYTATATGAQVAIQAACDVVGAAGGGTVFIRAGTYVFSAAVIDTYSNVTILGEGRGATILQANYAGTDRGVLSYHRGDSTPINNITIRDLSINLNNKQTGAIYVRGVTPSAVTSKNYFFENIEIYGRCADATGALGAISLIGTYGTTLGSLKNFYLRTIEIRDGNPTSGSFLYGTSILVLSDNLETITFDRCYIHDTYGVSIGTVSNTVLGRKDWVFDTCTFTHTIQNYFSTALADISDGNATGFNGIKVVNCHFDGFGNNWSNQDIYAMAIYSSINFIVDGCDFFYPRSVIAAGLSPGSKESQSWTFSNNLVYNCQGFTDPDGHYAGTYTNNVFWKSVYSIFGGYGRHYPSVFQGNLLYNCALNPQTDIIAHQSIFSISDGGNIIQDNVIFNDIASPNLLSVFAENSQGGSTAYPNVYKNNTLLGSQLPPRIFGTDAGFKHIIAGNTGITESIIKNSQTGGIAGDADLAASDILNNNYKADGTPIGGPNGFYSQGSVTGATTFKVRYGNVISAVVTGNITMTISSGLAGDLLVLKLTQDATGSRTATWPSNFKKAGGSLALSTAASATDIITMRYDGTNWVEVSRSLNVS